MSSARTGGPAAADPVVLVPGLSGLPAHDFAFLAPMLARTRSVVTVDLAAGPPTAAGLDAAIATAVEQAGDRAALLGVSIGAVAAVRFAAGHPGSVTALVAVAGWLEPGSGLHRFAGTWATLRRERSAALEGATAGALAHVLDVDRARGLPATAATDGLVALAAALAADGADRIAAPSLVVTAEHDEVAGERAGRLLAAAIPGARTAAVPTGHDVLAARPAEVLHLATAFLTAARPATVPQP